MLKFALYTRPSRGVGTFLCLASLQSSQAIAILYMAFQTQANTHPENPVDLQDQPLDLTKVHALSVSYLSSMTLVKTSAPADPRSGFATR